MKKTDALTVSIGVLAVVDTYVTATVFPVPVWVTFIAWASFFVVGGGPRGFVQSVASNLTGLAPLAVAICVGVGSAAMVQVSKLKLLNVLPAVVWGFASTVGTAVATGKAITTVGIQNPALVAAAALVTGAVFGIVSEAFGEALSHKPQPQLN